MQCYYNAQAGIKKLTTETGAGQWGTALSFACTLFGMEAEVWQVGSSYDQKPYRRLMMELYGSKVVIFVALNTAWKTLFDNIFNRSIVHLRMPQALAKPYLQQIQRQSKLNADYNGQLSKLNSTCTTPTTSCFDIQRSWLHLQHTGSLGIAISEAVEVAAKDPATNYALGSVSRLNHMLFGMFWLGQIGTEPCSATPNYHRRRSTEAICKSGRLPGHHSRLHRRWEQFCWACVSFHSRELDKWQKNNCTWSRASILSLAHQRRVPLRLWWQCRNDSFDEDAHTWTRLCTGSHPRRRPALSWHGRTQLLLVQRFFISNGRLGTSHLSCVRARFDGRCSSQPTGLLCSWSFVCPNWGNCSGSWTHACFGWNRKNSQWLQANWRIQSAIDCLVRPRPLRPCRV